MPSPPAGDFVPESEYNVLLTIRKGAIGDNPRGGVKKEFRLRPSEGFDIMKAKVMNRDNFQQGERLVTEEVYFKTGKSSPQSSFQILTPADFLLRLKNRWGHITQVDVVTWQNEGLSPQEGFKFEFFVYIHRPQRLSSHTTTLRRATATRIQEAATVVEAFRVANPNVQMGPITANHLAITHARRPAGAGFELPNDNTTQQAQQLDAAQQELAVRDQEAGRIRGSEERIIRIKVQEHWMDVTVDIQSLRAALGLPDHDLFHQGIYHGYQHPTMAGADDMVDVDHDDEQNPADRGV